MDLKLTPSSVYFFLFIYLLVELREVMKRFPTVRLGVEGRLPRKCLLQEV